jgi:hypothetical protein
MRNNPPTRKDLAAIAGVSVRTLTNWRAEGIDISSIEEVLERSTRGRVRKSPELEEAELRKIIAQADLLEHELADQRSKYVSKASQQAAGRELGAFIKALFDRMESDLTHRTAERPAIEVYKVLREYARASLTELAAWQPSGG